MAPKSPAPRERASTALTMMETGVVTNWDRTNASVFRATTRVASRLAWSPVPIIPAAAAGSWEGDTRAGIVIGAAAASEAGRVTLQRVAHERVEPRCRHEGSISH